MSGERDLEQPEDGADNRPVTAAARRERRGTARPATAGSGATTSAARKGRPTTSRDPRKSKGNIFQRVGRYLREVVAELRKVIWPTRSQLVTYTTVVLIFVAFIIALVAVLDFTFAKGVLWIFGDNGGE